MKSYPGRVTTGDLLIGIAAIATFVAATVAVGTYLAPSARTPPPQTATVEAAAGPPAARGCPGRQEIDWSAAIPVSSTLLIDCPSVFDGHVATYEGEVIDAVLRRGGRAWVQLNDDAYSRAGAPPQHTLGGNSGLAVSINDAAADRIHYTSGYDATGDRLRVIGTLLEADPADGGAPTIRAQPPSSPDGATRSATPSHRG